MSDHQDWKPVTWVKRTGHTPTEKKAALRTAMRNGSAVVVTRPSISGARAHAHKLMENVGDTGFAHATVTKNFCRELQSARLAKQLTQKALASCINERANIINEYESGAARPNQAVINKLNRALGVQLPSATKPPPKKGGNKK